MGFLLLEKYKVVRMKKVVNILGQDYEIIQSTKATNPKLLDCDAYVEFYSKKIVLGEITKGIEAIENIELYEKEVLRHEIVHAFLHESGMSEWAEDEVLVNFIAIQIHKLSNIFKELEI